MGPRTLQDVYDYALRFYGLPYEWGGGHDGIKDPYGVDCSGYVRRILEYANTGPHGDNTADDYYHYFLGNGILNIRGLGALAFFGKMTKVHHIGFCIDTRVMLSAANGGPSITTRDGAFIKNAMVKIEPINIREDFVCTIMPQYQLQ